MLLLEVMLLLLQVGNRLRDVLRLQIARVCMFLLPDLALLSFKRRSCCCSRSSFCCCRLSTFSSGQQLEGCFKIANCKCLHVFASRPGLVLFQEKVSLLHQS